MTAVVVGGRTANWVGGKWLMSDLKIGECGMKKGPKLKRGNG